MTDTDWADKKARTVVEKFTFGDVESMSLDELTDMSLANQAKIAQSLRDERASKEAEITLLRAELATWKSAAKIRDNPYD